MVVTDNVITLSNELDEDANMLQHPSPMSVTPSIIQNDVVHMNKPDTSSAGTIQTRPNNNDSWDTNNKSLVLLSSNMYSLKTYGAKCYIRINPNTSKPKGIAFKA